MVTDWKSFNDFQRARLKLTLLYLAVVFVILNLFTMSIFWVLQKEEGIHQKNIHTLWNQKEIIFPDNSVTIIKISPSKNLVTTQEVISIHHVFLEIVKKWILIIEGILIFLSGIFSYFLSGKTLKPIEEKNKKQKEFLSDVSHELKNPLSAIKMSVEIAKQQKKWKQGELHEIFKDIEGEIDALISTTQNLLFLEKKIEKTEKKQIFLEDILKKVEKKISPLLKEKNIHISFDTQEFSFFSYPEDVETVLFNLLHNGIKFSPPNKKIHISLLKNGALSVQDFGIGIAKKDLPHIFDRFYKIDSSRTFSDENGSGLGLSIVKKICKENGWKINVKSKEGEGTTFVVEFL